MMKSIQIYTIGFTKTNAENFFENLKKIGVKKIVDVRLNNISQLAGFAKKDDLKYFLKEIANIDYIHIPALAPTKKMFQAYKRDKGDWNVFKKKYLNLIETRKIEDTIAKEVIHEGCLLCSEHEPYHCHRSLVADYLKSQWDEEVMIRHIL